MLLTIDLDSQTADKIRILRRCERIAESQSKIVPRSLVSASKCYQHITYMYGKYTLQGYGCGSHNLLRDHRSVLYVRMPASADIISTLSYKIHILYQR